jgi:HSP20 family protein
MAETSIQKRENQQQVNVPERIEQSVTFTPLVDIIETNDEFIFQADLPGVKAGDVDVSYENGVLTISGKVEPRQPGQTNYLWQEYGVGNFYRQFTLSTAIDPDGIRAELKNGVLELHVPKAESAKTRKIEIKTA